MNSDAPKLKANTSLENFASTINGTAYMIHNTHAGGRVTLDELVLTLD